MEKEDKRGNKDRFCKAKKPEKQSFCCLQVDSTDKGYIDEEEDSEVISGGNLIPIEVENTGENRFSCFECDFNICSKCIEFIESETNKSLDSDTNIQSMKRNVLEGGGVAWQNEVRTLSKEVEMRQMNSNHRMPRRKSTSKVMPQN